MEREKKRAEREGGAAGQLRPLLSCFLADEKGFEGG